MDWSKVIRDYRATKSLTQEALAETLGVDARVLRRWEAGQTPSVSARKSIAKLIRPISPETEVILSLVENYDGGCVASTFDYIQIATSKSMRAIAKIHELPGLDNLIVEKVAPKELLRLTDQALSNPKIQSWSATASSSWLFGAVRFRHDSTARVMRDLPVPLIISIVETRLLKRGETVDVTLVPNL